MGSTTIWILWMVLVALRPAPYVTPFANAGPTSSSSPSSHQLVAQQLLQPPPLPPRNPITTTTAAATTATSSDATTTTTTTKNKNFISRLFFNYVVPLLQVASKRQLTVDDALLFQPSAPTTPSMNRRSLQQIYDRLIEREYDQHHQYQHPIALVPNATTTTAVIPSPPHRSSTQLLAMALLQQQRPFLIVTGLLRLTNTIVQAFPAVLVAKLLRSIEAGTTQPIHTSLLTAAALVSVLSIKMILENQYFHYLIQSSTNIRENIAGMIFNKSLRLQQGGSNVIRDDSLAAIPKSHHDETLGTNGTITADGSIREDSKTGTSASPTMTTTLGVGGVINLMQSDTSIIESAAMQFHTIWDGPLQIAIYTTLLFRYLGPSVLYGMAVLLLTIPVNSIALRILNRLSRYENEAKDARTKRTTESISHMKLLKLQNWEQQFAADIRFHRQKELQHFVSRGFIRAANSAISNAIPAVCMTC